MLVVCEFFKGPTTNQKYADNFFIGKVLSTQRKNLISNFYMKLSSIRNPTLSDKHTPSLEIVSTTFERKKVES